MPAGKEKSTAGSPDPKGAEAFNMVCKLLKAFKSDETLQDYLKDEDVIAAINHWSSDSRISHQIAEKRFNENYRVHHVFSRFKEIQSYCRQVPMGVPLKAILAGEVDPLYGVRLSKEEMEEIEAEDRENEPEDTKAEPKKAKKKVDKNDIVDDDDSKTQPEIQTPADSASDSDSDSDSTSWLDLTWRNLLIWWSVQIGFIASFVASIRNEQST